MQPASKTANVWRAALPKAAYNRLRQEQELLRAELAEEPPLTAAVDRAAAQAQRRDHEVRRQRLVQRLTELDNCSTVPPSVNMSVPPNGRIQAV